MFWDDYLNVISLPVVYPHTTYSAPRAVLPGVGVFATQMAREPGTESIAGCDLCVDDTRLSVIDPYFEQLRHDLIVSVL